jgi:tape measure domain-containing protein
MQALQSGALRGDEFNSVMENAPRLARLLADSLGVSVGQLRAMAEAGELTRDKLTAALTGRFTAGIEAEFQQLPVTFDQSLTQIQKRAQVAIGAFDRGGQFSDMLVNFMGTGETSMEGISSSAEETGILVRATFADLSDVFGPIVSSASAAFPISMT